MSLSSQNGNIGTFSVTFTCVSIVTLASLFPFIFLFILFHSLLLCSYLFSIPSLSFFPSFLSVFFPFFYFFLSFFLSFLYFFLSLFIILLLSLSNLSLSFIYYFYSFLISISLLFSFMDTCPNYCPPTTIHHL